MFKESNRRMRNIMSGKFIKEEVAAAQREFEGQIKLINAIVSAYGISSKNERAMVGLERMNIMDPHTAIDLGLGSPESDKVKCPDKDGLIYRRECLDRSGSTEHFDGCQECDLGKETKRLLIDKIDN